MNQFHSLQSNNNHRLPYSIWAIGGGKGGVGKSLVSSNLAITAAKQGYTVTLIDMDLGSANLHTCMGLPVPQMSISDFLSNRVLSFHQLSTPTNIKNLNFICGFNDALNVADIEPSDANKLMSAIREVNSQIVILDLGAGTNESTLDFFLMADRKVTVMVPEPTSIENAYRFIKAAFFRRLKTSENHNNLKWIIDEAMDHKNKYGIRSPADLIRHIGRQDHFAARRMVEEISSFYLDIIINQVRTNSDLNLGASVQSVCRKYFGIDANYLGHLDHDNSAWQALRKKKALVLEYPHSSLVTQFNSIVKNLVDPISLKAVV